MNQTVKGILLVILTAFILLLPPYAAAQTTFNVGYSSTSANYAALWVAKDGGIFDREEIKVEPIFIPSGTLLTQALLSGDVHVGFPNGGQVIAATARGADLTIIGMAVGKMIFSLMAPAKIRSAGELKGKKIGVTRFGSATDVSLHAALKKSGLNPDKDVVILQMGSIPNIMAALQNGSLEAGVLSPPTHWQAEKLGYKELINITDLNIAYPNPSIATSKRMLKEKEDALRRFMRGYVRGIDRVKSDKPFTKKVLAKYTLIRDDEIMEKVYDFYARVIEPGGRITTEALRGAVEEQSQTNPKIREMPLTAFYDDRFVR
ncbi:MAG TPA: ABC transporter substrate-binding protein [Verrucomicrobiae bacterium]|jgi:ABC-type nitrate/sulfonate/bicarbonate transport system substrate-binding protein|nr:ABC transporter substrate-binding protein [Verrucomicrobiae bacterium]